MAQIEDVYSLKFDSAQFESDINRAIANIEELQSAMEDTATSTEELESATQDLIDSLKVEAKGTEDLNKKRDVLVNTQKKLNTESKAYTVVGAEIDNTNKKIGNSTAETANKQKSFFGGLLQGARNLNSLKRATGIVTGAFRLLGGINPIGLAITALTAGIGIISNFIGATNKTKTALEQLNDPNLAKTQRLEILESEISRLNAIEQKTGELTEEEKKQRDELTAKYKETADDIVKIEEERLKTITELQDRAARLRVQLLGDSVAAVNERFKVESGILVRDTIKTQNDLVKEINTTLTKRDQARAEGNFELATEMEDQVRFLNQQITENDNILKLEKQRLAQEKQRDLLRKTEESARKKEASDNQKRQADEKLIADELERQRDMLEGVGLKPFEQTPLGDWWLNQQRAATEQEERLKNLANEYTLLSGVITSLNQIQTTEQEINTAKQIALLEQERNAKLLEATQSGKDQEAILKKQQQINENYNNQRAEIERLTNSEILKNRITTLESILGVAKSLGQDTLEVEKQIAELRIKLTELERPANIEIEADTEPTRKKISKLAGEIVDGVIIVGEAIFDAVEQGYQRLIARLDQAIQKSKSALAEIRANSEDFNARQLALEKERLEKLEAERKKAVAREKALAITRIAIDTSIAVAKAAGQTGVGAPIAIAGVLAAIIGGVASALSVAQGANFYEGSEFVDKERRYPNGRDMVPARLNRGERVITTEKNREYYNTLSAIHNGRIPASVINNFTSEYIRNGGALPMNLGTPSIIKQMPMILQSGVDMKGVEMRLDNLESVLRGLQMPSVKVTANANGIFKVVEKRRMNAARANKISR